MIDTLSTNSNRDFDLKFIAILNGYCRACNPNQHPNHRCPHFNNDEDDNNENRNHNSLRRQRRRTTRGQNHDRNHN